MQYKIPSLDEHFRPSGRKRILALDGGGLRGILTLAYLKKIETLLRVRHGNNEMFRLSHYFDLIAGTSTGAIIAAGLTVGKSVDEIIEHYLSMGRSVFKQGWFRHGIIRARYDEDKLSELLQQVLGKETTLGSKKVETGLLVMTKRLDTGSPWPLGNNPKGKFHKSLEQDDFISNADYPLWKVVRASTAAPSYFNPEVITISEQAGRAPVKGEFVDGGVSPFNNPALQALMYATLDGYKLNWPLSSDNLLLVSVGTGKADPSKAPAKLAAEGSIKALLSLMDDCSAHVETILQWMSASPIAARIDSEIGDLCNDLVSQRSLFNYVRYNVDLTTEGLSPLDLRPEISKSELGKLSAMDKPENLEELYRVGTAAAKHQIEVEHFPTQFDLDG